MAQDFWASSGFSLLERGPEGLIATDAWLARFADRPELVPPAGAGPREVDLHRRLAGEPRAVVSTTLVDSLEDPDARENWTQYLRFRDRVLAHSTLEGCYLDLFRANQVDIAPVFVDALAQVITRAVLEGAGDPWLARAAEMLFRRQRVSTERGQVLAADAATLEVYAETGGFGAGGQLPPEHLPPVEMGLP